VTEWQRPTEKADKIAATLLIRERGGGAKLWGKSTSRRDHHGHRVHPLSLSCSFTVVADGADHVLRVSYVGGLGLLAFSRCWSVEP
jgi:hypothetical protein